MGIVKIGPWGGEGGLDWDIFPAASATPHHQPWRLEAITVCSSLAVVDAISFAYSDDQGKLYHVGPWGGNGGQPDVVSTHTHTHVRFKASEVLTEVSGTFAYIGTQPGDAVTSLTFVTSLGRKHGPFGDVDGTPFSVPAHNGGSVVALFGRAWDYLDAIGVYVRAAADC